MTQQTWLVLSSGNGSGNLGDAMMWEAAAATMRATLGDVAIVTDGAPGWSAPFPGVEVLPYLVNDFRRYSRDDIGGVRRTVARALEYPGRIGWSLRRSRMFCEASRPGSALARRWRTAIEESTGVVFSGAGAITDDYAEHGVAAWSAIAGYARRKGKPIAFVGQGVGPLRRTDVRTAAAHMLAAANLVTVRESSSAAQARQLGVGSVVAPDWALARMPSAQERARAAVVREKYAGTQEFVAVTVHRRHARSLRVPGDLRRLVLDLCAQIEAAGLRPLLVPNAIGQSANDDIAFMRRLVRQAGSRTPVRIVEDVASCGEVRALYGLAIATVTTRYHPALFALAEGVPAYALSMDPYYDQKLRGALAWFDVDPFFSRIADAEPRAIVHALTRFDQRISLRETARRLAQEATTPLVDWLDTLPAVRTSTSEAFLRSGTAPAGERGT